jgi:hypothetical protein
MLTHWMKTQNTITKNKETLLDANKEVGLEVYTEKTKYMFTSHHQNAGQNHNKSFTSMAKFKYLGITITNQNYINEETKRRLMSEKACDHPVRNFLEVKVITLPACMDVKLGLTPTNGRTRIDSVYEQSAEENVWTHKK